MKTSGFTFELPPRLIAQNPPAERGGSRIMVLDRKTHAVSHSGMSELPRLLEKGTLMVFNNSRVRRARLYGKSENSGAEAEFLLLDPVDADGRVWRAMAKRASRRRIGSRYIFAGKNAARITGADGGFRLLEFDTPVNDAWLDVFGHIPLPPYIKRRDSSGDAERYQTVYSREYGSAAAPTAGLHFTIESLDALGKAGIETAFVTLHVGLGTFLPVRTENVEDHKMHEERFFIDNETAARVEKAKAEGRRILAVGTTSVRVLESAWTGSGLRRGEGSTSLFIYPGYVFKAVDALFTNFHTPGSTLLMLAAAFAGQDFLLQSYGEAVKKNYHFFSYGDACLIL